MHVTTELQRAARRRGAGQNPKLRLGELTRRRRGECVADCMTSSISVVSPETRLSEALYLVAAMNLKALAVYEGRRYVGFVGSSALTDVTRIPGSHAGHMQIREIMNMAIQPCLPQDSLRKARTRMHQTGDTCLPVIDEDGKVTGVLLSSAPGEEQVTNLEPEDARDNFS